MFYGKKKPFYLFLTTFLCSVLLHSLFFFTIQQTTRWEKTRQTADNSLVLVEYPAHRQIVSQKTFNKIAPKKHTPYLSQADKAVEKETQAMLKGLFHQAEEGGQSFVLARRVEPDNTKSFKRNISSLPQRVVSAPISLELSGPHIDAPFSTGDFSGQNPQQDRSRTMDFLPGVEFGSHTLLNTKEFIYHSYYSRMKEQLYWRWIQYFTTEMRGFSSTFHKRIRQGLFSTWLYVYLSTEGEVQDIRVVKSSGVEEIDSAALHAFLLAEPFPNPPKGLVEEDGYIHIKQSFHLYFSPATLDNLFSKQN